jgi:hypothetical protein
LISLLIGTTIWVCWLSKKPTTVEEENLEFSIVICLTILTSPTSWTHYYLFLLIPFGLYLDNRLAIPRGRIWPMGILASAFLTSLPVISMYPKNQILNFLYSKVVVSNFFLGGILLLGILLAARWNLSKSSFSKRILD